MLNDLRDWESKAGPIPKVRSFRAALYSAASAFIWTVDIFTSDSYRRLDRNSEAVLSAD
jgi:hypothetical protein